LRLLFLRRSHVLFDVGIIAVVFMADLVITLSCRLTFYAGIIAVVLMTVLVVGHTVLTGLSRARFRAFFLGGRLSFFRSIRRRRSGWLGGLARPGNRKGGRRRQEDGE